LFTELQNSASAAALAVNSASQTANACLNPDAFFTDEQAATLYAVSPGWLRQLRVKGTGPRFTKFGRAVRYRVGDLLAWAEARTANSTAEAA